MIDRDKIAEVIVAALRANAPGAWVGTHGQDDDDLADLTVDGTFDMRAIADAVVDAVSRRDDPENNPGTNPANRLQTNGA